MSEREQVERFDKWASELDLPLWSSERRVAWAAWQAALAQPAAQAVHSDVERDAARYRWLRGDTCPDHSPRWMEWEVRRWAARRWRWPRRADLDAAIDAAMLAAAPEVKP